MCNHLDWMLKFLLRRCVRPILSSSGQSVLRLCGNEQILIHVCQLLNIVVGDISKETDPEFFTFLEVEFHPVVRSPFIDRNDRGSIE